jgi:cbb3-type cytochrome oxidase subunit 3
MDWDLMARGTKTAVIALLIIIAVLGATWLAYRAGFFIGGH